MPSALRMGNRQSLKCDYFIVVELKQIIAVNDLAF
jgi:hypothetical protein